MVMYSRKCPKCLKEIKYENKYTRNRLEKTKCLCRECSFKIREMNYTLEQKIIMAEKKSNSSKGEKNSFWGKKHSVETIEILRDKSSINNARAMTGKSFYDVWLEKYGKDVADEKLKMYKNNASNRSKGEKNPMYGKPSPMGSGNGWSGWYNEWFFRSLLELSYMINVIERFNLKWESGETMKHKIEYIDYKGAKRNYFPDFIIEDKYVVECKPLKLLESQIVKDKINAAREFCSKNNLIFKVREINKLSKEEIYNLYISGKIIFTERYKKKFEEYHEGKTNSN